MDKTEYQQRLGERLRAIRNQQDLTLQQVEDKSRGRWKAVVIGAYERGDRAISAAKLADLASFYGVPVAELLPEAERDEATTANQLRRDDPSIVLDLTRLQNGEGATNDLEPVSRYASTIQLQRGDYNGHVLTLRNEDVRALAVVLGMTPDELVSRLERHGVLLSA